MSTPRRITDPSPARVAAGQHSKERIQEINHGSVSREDRQQEWARQRQYDNSYQKQIDDAKRYLAEGRRRTYRDYHTVTEWMKQFGNPFQKEIANWFYSYVYISGYDWKPKSVEEVKKNTLGNVSDLASDPKGQKFLKEVQDLLGLPSLTTPPPKNLKFEDISKSGLRFDDALVAQWHHIIGFEHKLEPIMQKIDAVLRKRIDDACKNIPEMYREDPDLEIKMGVRRGRFGHAEYLVMPINDVGGYPEGIDDNVNVGVGYRIEVLISGALQGNITFGVFPGLEASPTPRLLAIQTNGPGVPNFNLINTAVHFPKVFVWPIKNPFIHSHSSMSVVPLGHYEKAKTLSQADGLLDSVFDTIPERFRLSLEYKKKKEEDRIAYLAALQKERELALAAQAEKDRLKEEAKRQKEEAKRLKEEARQKAQAPKNVVDSASQEKISILTELESKSPKPEVKALATLIQGLYESGNKPDDEQLKRIRNYLYMTGMRAQADHFRVASASRVAAKWSARSTR